MAFGGWKGWIRTGSADEFGTFWRTEKVYDCRARRSGLKLYMQQCDGNAGPGVCIVFARRGECIHGKNVGKTTEGEKGVNSERTNFDIFIDLILTYGTELSKERLGGPRSRVLRHDPRLKAFRGSSLALPRRLREQGTGESTLLSTVSQAGSASRGLARPSTDPEGPLINSMRNGSCKRGVSPCSRR